MIDLNGVLKNVLPGLGFSDKWINWIKKCRMLTILFVLVTGIIC